MEKGLINRSYPGWYPPLPPLSFLGALAFTPLGALSNCLRALDRTLYLSPVATPLPTNSTLWEGRGRILLLSGSPAAA